MTDVRAVFEEGVTTIWFDRPESRNAIRTQTMRELGEALDMVVAQDPAVVILRGTGDRAFVSGGDLKELASIRRAADAASMAATMRGVLDRVASLPMPVIAALNGHAMGGGAEVSLAADFRIAADDVQIAFNQSKLEIMPAWGGIERLTRLVGRSVALQLLLLGERLHAGEAQRLGLIDIVVSRDQFEHACTGYAQRLADLAPSTSRGIKAVVSAVESNTSPHLEDIATKQFAKLWASERHWAAVRAVEDARRRRAPSTRDSSATNRREGGDRR